MTPQPSDHDREPSRHVHGTACDRGHGHGLTAQRLDRAMAVGVALNAGFVAAEVAAGFLSGSLALLADAGHNAGDVLGLLLAWGADLLARRPATRKYTWGFRRATIYAALVNAAVLLVACGGILWEAGHRLGQAHAVGGPIMIGVAAVGVVINTATALLFLRGHRDANVRGAFLHMAADAAVSLGVVVAGIAILLTGQSWIDPAVSILITLVIVSGSWGLLRESIDLALDAVPRGVDRDALEESLGALPGVAAVHDLRIWGPSTSEASLTAHVTVAAEADRDQVLAAAEALLRERFQIAHTTLQLEKAAARPIPETGSPAPG
jgi:cobalt-zinc-cadmium efflux system protein